MMSADGNEDVKPDVKVDRIQITVSGSNGEAMKVSVKSTTLIQKILDEYARRYQLEPLNLRLMFDGSHLSKTSTVGACGLEDGDALDVFSEQTGGAM